MYVYQLCNGEAFFVVGFFDPKGEWHTESDQNTREEAAARVSWLNGNTWANGTAALRQPTEGEKT